MRWWMMILTPEYCSGLGSNEESGWKSLTSITWSSLMEKVVLLDKRMERMERQVTIDKVKGTWSVRLTGAVEGDGQVGEEGVMPGRRGLTGWRRMTVRKADEDIWRDRTEKMVGNGKLISSSTTRSLSPRY